MKISELNIQTKEDYRRWTFNWAFYEDFRQKTLMNAVIKDQENEQHRRVSAGSVLERS